jgi:hypothetical protein
MPERAGSCQKPPEYGALPGQKLDLSVFKGSFWGWFGSRHAKPSFVRSSIHAASIQHPCSIHATSMQYPCSIRGRALMNDDVMYHAQPNAMQEEVYSPRCGGHKFLNCVNTMKRSLWLKIQLTTRCSAAPNDPPIMPESVLAGRRKRPCSVIRKFSPRWNSEV